MIQYLKNFKECLNLTIYDNLIIFIYMDIIINILLILNNLRLAFRDQKIQPRPVPDRTCMKRPLLGGFFGGMSFLWPLKKLVTVCFYINGVQGY